MSAHSASHAEHAPHLAHHFETPEQQFESGKLGMWLFLGTELLMFGGLFCAYAIYRGNHPEIFHYAHQFLDTRLGAINTVVLICSSLTMAWGVRAAQLGQRSLLILMLLLTLCCAGGFMGIKYVEYRHKISHGLLWGRNYVSQEHHGEDGGSAHGAGMAEHAAAPEAAVAGEAGHGEPATAEAVGTGSAEVASSAPVEVVAADANPDAPRIARAAAPPSGLVTPAAAAAPAPAHPEAPANPQIFFGIYFAMTGLHGIHVLAGMFVITWLVIGAVRGVYGPEYYTPVDLVGLYWHIVDLIWIFLFPLLYLID